MRLWSKQRAARCAAAVLPGVAASAGAATAAQAAFPGRNGEIAFAAQSDYRCEGIGAGLTPDPCGNESLVTDLDWQPPR